MSRENLIMIGAIIVIVVAIFVIRAVARAIVNKSADAIHNAKVRSDEKKNPPNVENLADRYRKP